MKLDEARQQQPFAVHLVAQTLRRSSTYSCRASRNVFIVHPRARP